MSALRQVRTAPPARTAEPAAEHHSFSRYTRFAAHKSAATRSMAGKFHPKCNCKLFATRYIQFENQRLLRFQNGRNRALTCKDGSDRLAARAWPPALSGGVWVRCHATDRLARQKARCFP